MAGRRPYPGIQRKDYKEMIINTVVQVKNEDLPQGWSENAKDLINKLLQRKEEARLGKTGPNSIKDHPWFKDINWNDLLAQTIVPPFIPSNVKFNLIIDG